MILRAPAKLNLYLKVLGKRKDGYHNIETVFERIALCDKIVLRSLKNGRIRVFCDHPDVPSGKNSLIYRMISLLKKECGVSRGAEVRISKKIPIAAGLGGGSSDAAGILMGLNKLWKLSLKLPSLIGLGRKLGADIPFFLSGCSFAVARGKGDEIMPLNWKAKFWHLLISFPIRLLSKDVYGIYARRAPAGLTKARRATKIVTPSPVRHRPGDIGVSNGASPTARGINRFIMNDLEQIVLKKAPAAARIKNTLEHMEKTHPLVSGSGPSVFSLFEKRKEAVKAKELLVKRFPLIKEKGYQTFIVPTL